MGARRAGAWADLAGSALRLPAQSILAEDGVAVGEPGPLLGLHNRDYPSLWAAHRLARYTIDELVPFREFVDRATNAAWVFAARLQAIERMDGGDRLTALFPTNPAKRAAAERAFQAFAIGAIPRRVGEGRIRVSGPLFAWGVCQLVPREGELLVGLTAERDGSCSTICRASRCVCLRTARVRRALPCPSGRVVAGGPLGVRSRADRGRGGARPRHARGGLRGRAPRVDATAMKSSVVQGVCGPRPRVGAPRAPPASGALPTDRCRP